jgi:hypothetical protein
METLLRIMGTVHVLGGLVGLVIGHWHWVHVGGKPRSGPSVIPAQVDGAPTGALAGRSLL